jgi:hypothetical protein
MLSKHSSQLKILRMIIIPSLQTMEGNLYLKIKLRRSSMTSGSKREKPLPKLKFKATWGLLLKRVSF